MRRALYGKSLLTFSLVYGVFQHDLFPLMPVFGGLVSRCREIKGTSIHLPRAGEYSEMKVWAAERNTCVRVRVGESERESNMVVGRVK